MLAVKTWRRLFVFMVLCGLGEVANAQLFDTTEYRRDLSTYHTSGEVQDFKFDRHREDTTLNFPHELYTARFEDNPQLNTGRIASPVLTFDQKQRSSLYFTNWNNSFGRWFRYSDSIRYYDGKTPRTKLGYAQGSGGLLFLNAEHSQNIASNWSFGLDYRRVKTHNQYYINMPRFNQERMTNVFATQAYTNYHSKNQNYEVFASFTNNKNTVKETFGVQNAEDFDLLSGRSKAYFGIGGLTGAQNTAIERLWHVKQFYRSGNRQIVVNDSTIVPDTLYTSIRGQWFHDLKYERRINRFSDDDINRAIFPDINYGETTLDSIFWDVVRNEVGYTKRDGNLKTMISATHESVRVKQLDFYNNQYQLLYVNGKANWSDSNWTFTGSTQIALTGFNAGNYLVDISGEKLNENNTWFAGATVVSVRPDFNNQFFVSNYYNWHQILQNENRLALNAGWRGENGSHVKLEATDLQNAVYFDTSAVPVQLNENVQFLTLDAYAPISMGKSWKADARFNLRYSSNDKIPMPLYNGGLRIYRQGYLFNNNMWARLGVEATYIDQITGYFYNPVVRQFVLSSQSIGGYPVVNVFLNMKVQTMTLFVSGRHLTQGMFRNDNFASALNPIMGRAFTLGVNWRLFD